MLDTIKARYSNGVLVPLEPLNFEEGEEVFVTLDNPEIKSWEERVKASKAAAGGWVGLIDAEALKRDIYRSRHRGLDCDCIYCAPAPGELPG